MGRLEKYMNVHKDYEVPEEMQALVLESAGIENLKITTIKVPQCGNNQLLARVDAAIACASDIKLVKQGSQHPLMYGWDISKHNIIIGHEGSVTIIKVGDHLKQDFQIGQRFAIQPAVPTSPIHNRERYGEDRIIDKIAVGYTLPGLFAEYVLLPEEVIKTSCIIPLPREDMPYFGVALSEPLSAVIAAQEKMVHISKEHPKAKRKAVIGPMKGGVTLVIGAGPMGLMNIEVALNNHPKSIIVSELLEGRLTRAKEIFYNRAHQMEIDMYFSNPSDLQDIIDEETKGQGVNDVIVALGISKIQEECLNYVGRNGVVNLFGGTRFDQRFIKIDSHKIHYDGVTIVGSSGSESSDIGTALTMIAEELINPGNYIAEHGGLNTALSLIKKVGDRKIDGKGVIYPHIKDELINARDWDKNKERTLLKKSLRNV